MMRRSFGLLVQQPFHVKTQQFLATGANHQGTAPSDPVHYHVPGQIDVTITRPVEANAAIAEYFSIPAINKRRKNLEATLSDIDGELQPMTVMKRRLDTAAHRYPDIYAYTTLALLSVQFCVLFNWVFFTFDWNLVEPMTYFFQYTCVWLGVAYYYSTGIEWTHDSLRTAMENSRRRRLYGRYRFDEARFDTLRAYTRRVEAELDATAAVSR